MPIQPYLVVILVALAVPLQSALAACQCYQETANSPEIGGYLELVPVPCTSTPPNHGWLKVPPDGNGNPSPPMYLALRSSRNLSGMVLLYSGEWSPGVPRVALSPCMCCGCSGQPPPLKFDFTPPDSERPSTTTCSLAVQSTDAYGGGGTCGEAYRDAQSEGAAIASASCGALKVCSGSFSNAICRPYDRTRTWFEASGTYTYSCYATYNLCR